MFSSLHLRPQVEKLAWEARAQLVWGKPADEIRTWLSASGASEEAADRIMAICLAERAASMRVKGLIDVAIAAGLIVISTLVAAGLMSGLAQPGARIGRGAGTVLVICGVAFVFGLTRAFTGVSRLLLGHRVQGADRDDRD